MIAGLGFTSFVIGFATKDILNNLLSGVLILWQQPFKIGDYIFIGSNQGQVEYIGVRATNLRKDDGEMVLIPNGDMYSSALTIRGAGAERRMLLKIIIGYDSDVDEAKRIIAEVMQRAEGVVEEPKSTAVVTDLTGEGVNLSIYFWINTDENSPIMVLDEVATEIKNALCGKGVRNVPSPSEVLQTPEKNDSPTETVQKTRKKKIKIGFKESVLRIILIKSILQILQNAFYCFFDWRLCCRITAALTSASSVAICSQSAKQRRENPFRVIFDAVISDYRAAFALADDADKRIIVG
jgi:small-conductance mechanosensitive channel